MNGKFKALTMAVVAMFCLTAVVCVVSDADTSADDTVEHFLYFELVNADGMVTDSDWIKFTSKADLADFIEQANKAFAYYGYPEIKYTEGKSLVSVKYNGEGSTSCFVGSEDGKEWVKVTKTKEQYQVATYIGLALQNGYISEDVYNKLSDEEKKNWTASSMSGDYAYVKTTIGAKPTDVPKEFPEEITTNFFVEVTAADGTVESSKWVEVKALKTEKSLVANANEAFSNVGLNKLTLATSSWGISITYDGGFDNVSYYADGSKWVKVTETGTQYFSKAVALSVGNSYVTKDKYDKFTEDAKSMYVEDKDMAAYGSYYYKTVDESTTGYKSDDGNTGLIVGVVVAVVALLAIGVFFFLRKK